MPNQTSAGKPASQMNSPLAWIVWSLGCVFYFYECLLQVSPSVMATELMGDFAVTGQTLGILSGVYFYSYASMQLPAGVMLDYFGPHRLLTMATAICAISTIAFGLTDNFFMACVARLMIGLGSAFAAIGTLKLAANWFDSSRFALLTGLMVTLGMLGAIGGEAPLAFIVDAYGWRNSMVYMGISGLVIALLIYFIAQDAPRDTTPHSENHTHDEPMLASFKNLVKNGQLWLVATYGGLMYMSTPVFCGLWGVPFLMLKLGLTKAAAAHYVSLIFVGWAVASPLWGIYSNKIGMRKPPMLIGAVGALITSLLFIYAPMHHGWILQIVLIAFGVFSAGFLPAFALAKELCSQQYVATGLSFMNMMNMIGIALAQPAIGIFLDLLWKGETVNNVPVYSLNSYLIALSILPLGILVALLLLPRIKETYCHQQEI